jgi:hypothetical protein
MRIDRRFRHSGRASAAEARAGIQYTARLSSVLGARRDVGANWMPACAGMTTAVTGGRISPNRGWAFAAGANFYGHVTNLVLDYVT